MSLSMSTLLGVVLALAPAPASSTASADARRAEAQTEFAAGERAWAAEDYATAAEHFARAQDLSPHPYTQYNLGLAQHRAGDHVAAWQTFEELIDNAETTQQRNDAIRAQARVRAELAFVEVRAAPSVRVCLDGTAVPPRQPHLTDPGAHELVIDGRPMPLTLAAGESRVIEVAGRDAASRRRRSATIGLGIFAAASSAAAVGLATAGALAHDEGTGRGLTIGAAASGGVALGTVVALLVVQARRPSTRARARHDHATATPSC